MSDLCVLFLVQVFVRFTSDGVLVTRWSSKNAHAGYLNYPTCSQPLQLSILFPMIDPKIMLRAPSELPMALHQGSLDIFYSYFRRACNGEEKIIVQIPGVRKDVRLLPVIVVKGADMGEAKYDAMKSNNWNSKG